MNQKEIAICLESIAKSTLDIDIKNTIFDVHHIQLGTFAEVMIFLLRRKSDYKDNIFIDWFIRNITAYLQIKMEHIPIKTTQNLFYDFLSLLQ